MDTSLAVTSQTQPLSSVQFEVKAGFDRDKLKTACVIADSVKILAGLSNAGVNKICSSLTLLKSHYHKSRHILRLAGIPMINDQMSVGQSEIRKINAEIFIESRTRLSVTAVVEKINSSDSKIFRNCPIAVWSRLNGTGISVLLGHIRYRLSKGEELVDLLDHYGLPEKTYNQLLKYKDYLHLSKGRSTPAITEDGKISCLIRFAYLTDNPAH